jgi:hypothetical protein
MSKSAPRKSEYVQPEKPRQERVTPEKPASEAGRPLPEAAGPAADEQEAPLDPVMARRFWGVLLLWVAGIGALLLFELVSMIFRGE